MTSQKRLTQKRPVSDEDWLNSHEKEIHAAECLIAERLASAKSADFPAGSAASVAEVVFNSIVSKGLGSATGAENNSVLLLGEAGSGKTHIVEHVLKRLHDLHPSVVLLRAQGSAYHCDVECLRHIALQVDRSVTELPRPNATFEQGMEWIRNIFRNSFSKGTAVVMVLEEFEHFCFRSRQTLLYNLFDITQEVGVHLSIIGTSTKIDVMELLEKRIRSRFSMRHMHTFLPKTFDELLHILMAKLALPEDSGLCPQFTSQFQKRVEAALQAMREEWNEQVEIGRSVAWFLSRCLPISSLLRWKQPSARATKRARTSCLAGVASLPISTDRRDVMTLLLSSLSEKELIVLLALQRLHHLQSPRTLATVLYEIKRLHDETHDLVDNYNQELYSSAFVRLQQQRLLNITSRGSADGSKCHQHCESKVLEAIRIYLLDLGNLEADLALENPLRRLPAPVLQWAQLERGSGPLPVCG